MFEENKDTMIELRAVDKLAGFVPCRAEKLLLVCCANALQNSFTVLGCDQEVLKLLFNLSFDKRAREDLVQNSIPKIVRLMC